MEDNLLQSSLQNLITSLQNIGKNNNENGDSLTISDQVEEYDDNLKTEHKKQCKSISIENEFDDINTNNKIDKCNKDEKEGSMGLSTLEKTVRKLYDIVASITNTKKDINPVTVPNNTTINSGSLQKIYENKDSINSFANEYNLMTTRYSAEFNNNDRNLLVTKKSLDESNLTLSTKIIQCNNCLENSSIISNTQFVQTENHLDPNKGLMDDIQIRVGFWNFVNNLKYSSYTTFKSQSNDLDTELNNDFNQTSLPCIIGNELLCDPIKATLLNTTNDELQCNSIKPTIPNTTQYSGIRNTTIEDIPYITDNEVQYGISRTTLTNIIDTETLHAQTSDTSYTTGNESRCDILKIAKSDTTDSGFYHDTMNRMPYKDGSQLQSHYLSDNESYTTDTKLTNDVNETNEKEQPKSIEEKHKDLARSFKNLELNIKEKKEASAERFVRFHENLDLKNGENRESFAERYMYSPENIDRSVKEKRNEAFEYYKQLLSEKALLHNPTPMTWETYHGLDTIYHFLEYLNHRYSNLCTVRIIGRSVEGRNIKIIRISNGMEGNTPVWIDAGIHAREWIGPAALTYIINHIVKNFWNLPEHVKNKDWYILPVANPDGYVFSHTSGEGRMWRKNRACINGECVGVDLNRNFGFGWGCSGSSPEPNNRFFRGLTPFSEPESQAIKNAIMHSGIKFKVYISLHSYGQKIIFPFACREELCPGYIRLLGGATTMSKAIFKSTGHIYKVGTSADMMYRAAGTSQDWCFGTARVPYSYLIELCEAKHKFNMPQEDIEKIGKEILSSVIALMNFVDMYPVSKAESCHLIDLIETKRAVKPSTGSKIVSRIRSREPIIVPRKKISKVRSREASFQIEPIIESREASIQSIINSSVINREPSIQTTINSSSSRKSSLQKEPSIQIDSRIGSIVNPTIQTTINSRVSSRKSSLQKEPSIQIDSRIGSIVNPTIQTTINSRVSSRKFSLQKKPSIQKDSRIGSRKPTIQSPISSRVSSRESSLEREPSIQIVSRIGSREPRIQTATIQNTINSIIRSSNQIDSRIIKINSSIKNRESRFLSKRDSRIASVFRNRIDISNRNLQ